MTTAEPAAAARPAGAHAAGAARPAGAHAASAAYPAGAAVPPSEARPVRRS
ncbi:hypothetical protein HMPREF1318_3115 [Actinomyces massiliensis F0489]|uniref:Uncharacterized protein n=3 Tax=Actinomyces TaxID=1654 RepID=J1GXT4_9ACTO|nr:hypothetical protein HMPREF1318_3115 [Actinomyces massiliensis F0489]